MTGVASGSAPDEETIARALLTHCIDSADALMFATLKGCESATALADLLLSIHGGGPGRTTVETCFAHGLARWGRHVTAQGVKAFHRALARWLTRMDTLPTVSPEGLIDHFTCEGALWLVAPHNKAWPQQLADLSVRADWAPPLCLWGRGDIDALTSCAYPIAVVGSRGANDYGREVARSIARTAVHSGHLVVSGGALGIDAAAHWGALDVRSDQRDCGKQEVHGRTVAVFAGGLDHIGPHANDNLFAGILEHHGALISELGPQVIPEPRRFLLRNRIIAALASCVIVAQARRRSGALNTANWAADLGREIYAVPGEIIAAGNAGCNALIRDNKAMILCSVNDIEALGLDAHVTDAAPESTEDDLAGVHRGISASSEDAPYRAMVLRAIRSCRARGRTASIDNVLDALHAGQSPVPPVLATPQGLTRLLGVMELEGSIAYRHGAIVIPP